MISINNYILTLLVLLFISVSVYSQNKEIDSLKVELESHKTNDTTKVNLLNALSVAYSTFDMNISDDKVQEAYDLALRLNYKKGEAKSLLRFSRSQLKKGEIDAAEAYALQALTLCKELNDQACINSAYMGLAQVAFYNSDIDKATDYYKIILNKSIENGDSLSQADILNNLGISSYKKGEFDEALVFFKQANNIREQLGKAHLGIGTINNIAVISLNQGRYTEALEYFNKCLSIHKKTDDKDGIAQACYNISAVYYELKKYDKTLNYIDEALEIYQELEYKRMVAGTLINKGAVYADLKEFPKALEYMTKSLSISKAINDTSELSAAHSQLGDLYFLMEQPEKALEHYKTCLELSLSIEDQILNCRAYIGLAKTYVKLKDYSNALVNAQKGQQIADDLELLAQQKLVSETLSNIYGETENYKKAFENHQQFKMLSDSIFNAESVEEITQLEYEYKYKQALDSASIRELKLTKTVFDTSQDLKKSQRNLLLGVIGFLVTTLILGTIIFFLKLRNEKSKTQNVVIEQKLLRSQMTPHFIFNSLSVLQGMILNREEKKSVSYLSKFSKLLRTILENSRDRTVLLSQELIAVENYLALQNLENEWYAYTITVEDTMDTSLFKIPPMLIQPFVENAIEHAFVNLTGNRTINIALTHSDEGLICIITDNGVGIDNLMKGKKQGKKSLSTTITSERLQILSKDFKKKGAVTVEDRKKYNQQGTIVTLTIPYKTILSSENINN